MLEGRVEPLPPPRAALTFKAAGRTVRTDSSTRFVDGSDTRAFADLQIGRRVHVKGSMSGDTFTAAQVELQSAAAVPVEVVFNMPDVSCPLISWTTITRYVVGTVNVTVTTSVA